MPPQDNYVQILQSFAVFASKNFGNAPALPWDRQGTTMYMIDSKIKMEIQMALLPKLYQFSKLNNNASDECDGTPQAYFGTIISE